MINIEEKLLEIFRLEITRNKWRSIIPLMGTTKDRKLAKKIGVTAPRIAQVRALLGIAPVAFPKQCERYGAEFRRKELC